jgi:hypothetical protein
VPARIEGPANSQRRIRNYSATWRLTPIIARDMFPEQPTASVLRGIDDSAIKCWRLVSGSGGISTGWASKSVALRTRLCNPVKKDFKLKLCSTSSPFVRNNAVTVDPNR